MAEEQFSAFCNAYSLLRRLSKIIRNEARIYVRDYQRLNEAMGDITGSEIDKLVISLTQNTDLKQKHISFVSKIAAFARPDSFVAWDSYARKGIANILYNRKTCFHTKYETYLGAPLKIPPQSLIC